MADADLHIIINNAGDVSRLDALLNEAIKLRAPVVKVPAGYRCVECYSSDGTHTPTCTVGMTA